MFAFRSWPLVGRATRRVLKVPFYEHQPLRPRITIVSWGYRNDARTFCSARDQKIEGPLKVGRGPSLVDKCAPHQERIRKLQPNIFPKEVQRLNPTENSPETVKSNSKRDIERLKASCAAPVTTVKLDTTCPSRHQRARYRKVDLIASYNLDETQNSLYIPGAPPLYTEQQVPIKVERNMQSLSRTATLETHLLHALSAIPYTNPGFQFSQINIVISFAAFKTLLETYRRRYPIAYLGFPLQMVRKTLFIDLFEWTAESHFSMYDFASAVTTMEHGMPRTAKHYRWIYYRLGNMRIAVWMTAEAYLASHDAARKEKLSSAATAPLKPLSAQPPSPARNIFLTPNKPVRQKQLTILAGVKNSNAACHEYQLLYALTRTEYFLEGTWKRQGGEPQIVKIKERKVVHPNWRGWLGAVISDLSKVRAAMIESGEDACVALLPRKMQFDVFAAKTDQDEMDVKKVPEKYRVRKISLEKDVVEWYWGHVKDRTQKPRT